MSEPANDVLADLRSALDRLTRPPVLTAAAAFLLLMLLTVAGPHLLQLAPPSGGRIDVGTGDFLAFWTGAVLIHEGPGTSLYDFASQRSVQEQVLGGVSAKFQPYLNPPLLAIALSPLVPRGYIPAFQIWVIACTVFLVVGIAMLLRLVPSIRQHRAQAWALVFVIASYQPMFGTTVGGQNTPITFALLAGLALALKTRSYALAALALGLLTFKPQYAVGAGIALLFAGNWPVIAGGAMLGACHWLIGAWWSGPRWPLDMLAFLQNHRPLEIAFNVGDHFSWGSIVTQILPPPLPTVLATLGSMAVLAAWWRFREFGRRADPAWFALVVCGTMLASPHQQYYDVAILALPAALLVERRLTLDSEVSIRVRLALAAAYLGYPLWNHSASIGFQPLFLVLLGVAAWAVQSCYEAERAPVHGDTEPNASQTVDDAGSFEESRGKPR